MAEFRNLVQLLEERATSHPDRVAFTFLTATESENQTLTYGQLARSVRARAAAISAGTRPGDRVLLIYPSGLEYISAFFASLYAGTVAVPAYPPRPHKNVPDQNLERLKSITRDAAPTLLLTSETLAGRIRDLEVPELMPIEILATDRVASDANDAGGPSDEDRRVDVDFGGDRIAYLQYTSGSTGDPRGVIISHGQLLANEEMIKRIATQTEDSIVVGWLPLYHDMGLIGQILQPIYNGGHCVVSSPMSFLQKPLRWLKAIHDFRGTTSIAPNFGYELCVERITPAEIEGLDLSCWTEAFIGSEPIRADIMRAFTRTFAPAGFCGSTFFPCYGLAEATLAVTGTRPGPEFASLHLDSTELARGVIREIPGPAENNVPAKETSSAGLEVVSCGGPAVDVDVLIVDPETRVPRENETIGEIWTRGPAVARGYWNRAEETTTTFAGRLAGGDDSGATYLRTGDLGFLKNGELYVTGRRKELVILDGKNHYPHDLEAAAEAAHPAFRNGSAAAFSIEQGRGEELVVALEVRREARGTPVGELQAAAAGALSSTFGVRAREILMLRAGSLPRTSSGKLQRIKTRLLYLTGELQGIMQ